MQFQMMDRARIQPSPLNPRKHFDPEKLQELAETMLNGVGIIEPLVVRSRPDLNCYELVAGERRWRAAAIALLDEVPVIVKELSDAQMLEIMVIENNQREDVSALEEAVAPVRDFQEWIRDNVRLKVDSAEAREEFPALAAVLEKAEAVVNITHHYDWEASDVSDGPDAPKVYSADEWRRADGRPGNKKCPGAVVGLVVVGRDRGDSFAVCIDKKCKVHFPPVAKASTSSSSSSASHKKYLAQIAKQRKQREVREAAWKRALPELRKAIVAKIGALTNIDALVRLVAGVEYFGRGGRGLKEASQALGLKKLDALGALRSIALAGVLGDIGQSYGGEAAAKRAGVDVKALVKKAQKVQTSAPTTKGAKAKAKKAA
jgi:hypothetical protein